MFLFLLLLFCMTGGQPEFVYLKYEIYDDSSCHDLLFTFYFPVFFETSSWSICVDYFDDSFNTKFVLTGFSPETHLITLSKFSLSKSNCGIVGSDIVHYEPKKCKRFYFNNNFGSKFSVLGTHLPKFLESDLKNEKEYASTSHFSKNGNCEDLEKQVLEKTSVSFNFQNFRISKCNDTFLIRSIPLANQKSHHILEYINITLNKCLPTISNHEKITYQCVDDEYLKNLENSVSSTDYILNSYHYSQICDDGDRDTKIQLILKNGVCLPVEYFSLYEPKFTNFQNWTEEIASRVFYEENGDTALFEIFEFINPCSQNDVLLAYYVPDVKCQFEIGRIFDDVNTSRSFSTNKDLSVLSDQSRILALPLETCGLSESRVEKMIKKIITDPEDWDFDVIGSFSSRSSCISSRLPFGMYPSNVRMKSISGRCINNRHTPLIQEYPDSYDCDFMTSHSEERLGNVCEKITTNYFSFMSNRDSIWYVCQPYECFGYGDDEDGVCNSNGRCVSPNTCECNTYWYGEECESSILGMTLGPCFVLFCCCCCCCVIIFMSFLLVGIFVFVCSSFCGLSTFCGFLCCQTTKSQPKSKNKMRRGEYERIFPFNLNEENHEEDEEDGEIEFEGDENGDGKLYRVIKRKKKKTRKYLIFSGEFSDGKKEGKGVEYYVPSNNGLRDGEDENTSFVKFEGAYKNGKRNGKGIEYFNDLETNEKTICGFWKNGMIESIERDFVDLPKFKLQDFQIDFVKDRIGQGSEGDVFKISYQGNDAALKILRDSPTDEPNETHGLEEHRKNLMFVRSQKIWSKVSDHPYIAKLYAWTGLVDGPKGYISELCAMSLSDAIRRDLLTWTSKMRVMSEVAIGMSFLHSKSIMHRDLKISNILLDNLETVRVCDFEFARYDDMDWKRISNMSVLGTPVGIAPEIIQGKLYSKKCDVFGFGILVACLVFSTTNPYLGIISCTGCNENLSKSQLMIHQHVSKCGLRPVLERGLGRDEEWVISEVVRPCLEQNPEKRPSFEKIVNLLRKRRERDGKKKKSQSENNPIILSEQEKLLKHSSIN